MTTDSWEGEGEVDDNGGVEEEDERSSSYSDSEFEDASEDDDDEKEEEEEEGYKTRNIRGRATSTIRIEGRSPLKQNMSAKRGRRRSRDDDYDDEDDDEHEKVIISGKRNRKKQFDDRPTQRHRRNNSIERKFGNLKVDDTDDENEVRNNDAVSRGRTIQTEFDEKTPLRMDLRLDRKGGLREKSPPRFRRTDRSAGQSTESSRERLGFSRARGRTYSDSSSSI